MRFLLLPRNVVNVVPSYFLFFFLARGKLLLKAALPIPSFPPPFLCCYHAKTIFLDLTIQSIFFFMLHKKLNVNRVSIRFYSFLLGIIYLYLKKSWIKGNERNRRTKYFTRGKLPRNTVIVVVIIIVVVEKTNSLRVRVRL